MTNKILVTKDYHKFSFLKGNRAINIRHLNNLITSIKEKDLKMPIIVNEELGVLDGQHRLKAYQTLNLSMKLDTSYIYEVF